MKKIQWECAVNLTHHQPLFPLPSASHLQPTVAPLPPPAIYPPIQPPPLPPLTPDQPQPPTLSTRLPRLYPLTKHLPQPSTSTTRPSRLSPLTAVQLPPSTSSTTALTPANDKVRAFYDKRRELLKDIIRHTIVTDTNDNKTQFQFSLDNIRQLLDIAAGTVYFAPLSLNAKTDCLGSKLTVSWQLFAIHHLYNRVFSVKTTHYHSHISLWCTIIYEQ